MRTPGGSKRSVTASVRGNRKTPPKKRRSRKTGKGSRVGDGLDSSGEDMFDYQTQDLLPQGEMQPQVEMEAQTDTTEP